MNMHAPAPAHIAQEREDEALGELLAYLKDSGYRFTTITPATHERVLKRPGTRPATLRDVFGWSRPFHDGDLNSEVVRLLREAGGLIVEGGQFRSAYRVSTLGRDLFVHSAFPTEEEKSIFFGPDTYRFARLIGEWLPGLGPLQHIVDMGAGSGAGGIAAARLRPNARLTLVDTNPAALRIAKVNARAAGVDAEVLQASEVPNGGDLLLANPPYMIDRSGRTYRDGGALFGGEIALDWAKQALRALHPSGAMLLYTGAAILKGAMPLEQELRAACRARGATLEIEELDPDVFGEELDEPAYAQVERIALVGALIKIPG